MRTGPQVGQTSCTFEIAIRLSCSAMPPWTLRCGLGRTCFFTIITCSTRILRSAGNTRSTRPSLPLSRPVMTFTVSFRRISTLTCAVLATFAITRNLLCPVTGRRCLQNLGRQRNDFQEFLFAQFARRHFRHQRRLADDFLQSPALQLRQRSGLLEPHHVTDVRFVVLVVGIELLVGGDDATIKRMRLLAGHFHHDRLLHLVGDDFPYDFFAPSGCRLCRLCHYLFSVTACPVRARSPRMVLTRAMSLRRPRIFFRLSVWPMLSWNFSLNSWSAS